MPKQTKLDKGIKNLGKIGAIVGGVVGIISAIEPITEIVSNKILDRTEERKEFIEVPPLYIKDFPVTIEQAVEVVNMCGLKAIPSKLPAQNILPKYKDCIENQVISSTPSQKTKVKPGTVVVIQYITQDVIDECQKIFKELEERKIEEKQKKLTNKAKNNIKKIFKKEEAM